MTTDFKPRFTWETFRHDKWTYLFCHGGPTMDACPMFEHREPAEWHIASDFCKATGACIHHADVEATCPRREELNARLHADAVARKKAEVKAKHEHDAAHPRVKDICLPEKPVKGYMCDACRKVPVGAFPGFLCPACQRAIDTHADLF